MPRGKLHYNSEIDEERGLLIETWNDPHGQGHMQISFIESDDDEEEDDEDDD